MEYTTAWCYTPSSTTSTTTPAWSVIGVLPLTRQCLKGRRFGTIEEIRRETKAWQQRTNDKQRGVDWQFRVDDARIKLKSLYPKLIT